MSAHCRSCGAEVLWLNNERTHKRAPIDAEPSSDGNVRVDPLAGTYRVLGQDQRELARADGSNLYTNHFQTCPQQAKWHKQKAAAP